MLLIGETNTGKSVLIDKLTDNLVKSLSRQELQFVLLDMTGVDFWKLRDEHQEHILCDIKFHSQTGLAMLEELAEMVEERAKSNPEQLIMILIEECDIALLDQERFDTAVMRINKSAQLANIKLIYSTSRPGPNEVSGKLAQSFDLILAGKLERVYRDRLELPVPHDLGQYDFTVTER
jgi:DNA segregation ATPase FtsK/SpoIIIE-like protein